MRLFVGIPVQLEIHSPLRGIDGVKVVKEENLHITLKFIGDVDVGRAKRIAAALEDVVFTPFSVHLEGVGAFPSVSNPRVVWIGIKDGFDEIVRLGEQIDELLSGVGIPREGRPLHPHITIGRVKRQSPEISERIRKYAGHSFGSFLADRFLLYRSTLTPDGPIYEVLGSYEGKGIG